MTHSHKSRETERESDVALVAATSSDVDSKTMQRRRLCCLLEIYALFGGFLAAAAELFLLLWISLFVCSSLAVCVCECE